MKKQITPKIKFSPKVETLGTGKECVYVYHYPTQVKNLDGLYPCKIGKTTKSPTQRIANQTATGIADIPMLDLLIYTDNSTTLESVLHGIFTLKDRKLDQTLGKEWFNANPQEIKSLCKILKFDK